MKSKSLGRSNLHPDYKSEDAVALPRGNYLAEEPSVVVIPSEGARPSYSCHPERSETAQPGLPGERRCCARWVWKATDDLVAQDDNIKAITGRYSAEHTDFTSVYSSRTSWPISRPQPDCLYPPKGSAASKML